MHQKINRLTKKVYNFQELLTHLKDIGLSKEALNALQVSSNGPMSSPKYHIYNYSCFLLL